MRSSRKWPPLGEVRAGFRGEGVPRGRNNLEGKGGRGESEGVLGTVNGTKLIEWQFSKLLFTVTHGEQHILYCDLIRDLSFLNQYLPRYIG